MRLHFMGIGGVGMAGLAFLFKQAGHEVTGCDKYATARTRWLQSNGIEVAEGHFPDHLQNVSTLVVTPAVPQSTPELAAALASESISVRYRGELLAELFNAAPCGIAVCGTHGKTTTSTFTTKLLAALGADPSWCIGGETGAMPVAGQGASNAPFVIEADESDGTLALYHASILVVMNMDWDHPEHFPTEASYRACYATAMTNARQVIRAWELPSDDFPEILPLVTGAHNVVNARAAVEVALRLGYSRADIVKALPSALSLLPNRRFELIAQASAPSVKVYTDYAHHPRELACAVAMAKSLKPSRLRVLFQPHRYSRTRALLEQFPPAFDTADEVVLIPVYAAFEQPMPGGDIADLYNAFRERGISPQNRNGSLPKAYLARSAEEAWLHAFLTREEGDLILLAGAGDVISLVPRIHEDLQRGTPPPAVHRWIGAGSNTWRSDLVTGEIYERTSGPADQLGATLGIPWMAGIPGTIGGWVKMNAGAFGHSISEVIRRVKVDGAWLTREQCGFAYRHSQISGEIQDVEFDLPSSYERDAAFYLAQRRHFPAGTKGSVFKNPSSELPAGRLLEEAGAKKLRVGGAFVWSEHANVIVAGEGATPSDVLALARLMANAVLFRHGVRLEPEVQGLVTD